MSDFVFERNARLRDQLLQTVRVGASPRLWRTMDEALGITTAPTAPVDPAAPIHVVISFGEINDQHGTGPLVQRVFRGRPGIFSIRFRDDWGVHEFGDWHVRLSVKPDTLSQTLREVRRILADRNVQTVTCVPFTSGELLTALAVKEATGAKLCVWIMDDQNIAASAIPDAVMKEFLEACSLRLMTHPELRAAYQSKYGLPTYILPAVVPAHLVRARSEESAWDGRTKSAAILGSFWDQSWFDRLSSALEHCDCATDWYGQNHSPWLKFPQEKLDRARITPLGIVPEDRLAVALNRYPFVIVPAGALDGQDNHTAAASLSLPGRILFAAATSQTPILVVGSERNCGARFVTHFGIGAVAPYDTRALAAAMDHLRLPQVQDQMRRNAAAISATFSDEGVAAWLAASIEQGRPVDARFETAFERYQCETK